MHMLRKHSQYMYLIPDLLYRGADKSLARPTVQGVLINPYPDLLYRWADKSLARPTLQGVLISP
jgi:hypothetical protein